MATIGVFGRRLHDRLIDDSNDFDETWCNVWRAEGYLSAMNGDPDPAPTEAEFNRLNFADRMRVEGRMDFWMDQWVDGA